MDSNSGPIDLKANILPFIQHAVYMWLLNTNMKPYVGSPNVRFALVCPSKVWYKVVKFDENHWKFGNTHILSLLNEQYMYISSLKTLDKHKTE